jgi:hypothetical protein
MLAAAPLAASGDSGPKVVFAQPGMGNGTIERFTMRFSSAMVPLGDPRAAAPFATACPGQGRWVDERTWVYDFAAPLAGGTTCRFDVRQGLRDVAGSELGGQRTFTVDAGGPVARAILPVADGDAIEEDQVFLVAANLPPTRGSVAAHAYCAVDGIGERVPVDLLGADVPAKLLTELGIDQWPTSRFVEQAGLPSTLPATAGDRARALAGVVALKCRRPLPPGRDMALVWGAGIAAAGGRTAGADQRFDFTVRKPFTARFECSRTNPQAGCNPIEKAWVRFSAPVPTAQAAKVRLTFDGGVSIAPSLSDEQKRAGTIEDLSFAGPLPFAQAGRVEVPAGLADESGRALVNAARFPLDVRTDAAPPLVKFAAGFGILESRAGGVLPVTVRAVEPALQGKRLGVGGRALRIDGSDGEIARWLAAVDHADDEETTTRRRGRTSEHVNLTGSRSILPAGTGEPLSIALPGKGRDFEVVGIPLKQNGFYVVELASPVLGQALLGRRAPRYVAAAALVTNMAVHFKWGRERSLAWVTSLDTAKPVSNAQVRITDSCTGRMLARGVTDRSGGLMIPTGLPQPETYGGCEGGGAHPLMVSARTGDDFSFTLTDWGDGIRPYDFDLPYGYAVAGEMMHSVFDRALVRQGEVIHMKHLLRRPVGAGFAVPPDLSGTLKLTHGGSGTVFEMPLTIRGGSGESSWRVPAGAPMGDYGMQVEADDRVIDSAQSFRVDEYKLPTMRASVTGPAKVAKPGTLPIDLFVGYLSGGGASNLAVDLRVGWSLRSESVADWPGYTFGGAAIAEGVTPLDAGNEAPVAELPPMQLNPATLGADGAKRTSVEVPDLPVAADMRVEMDYRDANGEVLTASRTTAVLPSAVQIGVATDGWLMKADDLRLKMVALDLQGKPIKGQRLSVALYSREILTARRRLIGGFYAYDNRMRTTRIDADCSATTDAQGLARCTIDADVSGEVYAVVTTKDADGRVARTTRSVWLAGDDDWWFGGDNGDRMDVVPERTSYAAGETARIQVRMPFREATALVTVEREGVMASYVTTLSGRDPVVEVKLPASYAPDVFISVMAVRGRVESGFWSWMRGIGRSLGLVSSPPEGQAPTALVDLAKPAYRLGIAKLKVGQYGHRLRVVVKADRDRFAPRETAQVQVAVQRPDGQPARTADVAFVAVDEALLQLAPNPSWDVLDAMMGERPLSVLTATAQMQVVGKRHYGRKAVEAGGGGGDASALNRENFQPVLLWRGRVPLDAQGRARVEVPLSDALSSFKLVAIATEGAGLFGTGETAVRTAQDLTIYAGLPPLVREGDRFAGAFTLRNGSARAMTVTARVTLAPGVATGMPLTVTIPAGGAAPVAWNLTAPAGLDTLRWQVSATSADGRAADQVSVSQDVVPAVPIEAWAASLLRVGDASQLMIAPPAGALPNRGSVEVALTDSLAPSLAGVRAYMAGYPYQCFEQRLSRIVVLGDRAGWDRLAGEMPTYQAADGLLRYFPGETLEGSEALTAYVLSLTSEAGLPIPAAQRQRMIDALGALLDGRLRREAYGDVRLQRVAALAALARAGAATPAMLEQIGMPVTVMPTSALTDYLVALDRIPGLANAPALRRNAEAVLRSRLVFEGTRLDLVDQDRAAWWLMQSGDEAALKAVLATLGRPGWESDAPRMMTGATLRQVRGHWDTTPANAWGAVAARAFARVYPREAVSGTTMLSLARANVSRTWPLAGDARAVSLPLTRAPLVLRQSGGAGPWATVTVRAAVPLAQPLFAGYRLSRSVAPVQVRHPGRLTRGDVVRVTLTIDASAERNWVVVDDPVPAGGAAIGDLGGQSAMLGEGGEREGVSPAYVERARGSWRAYFAWLPRGRTTVSYAVRLSGSGRFVLPPTRVEAMYSPAVRAAVPNAPVEVGPR